MTADSIPVLSKEQREQIFQEECAARGVDPIPPTDLGARRRRAIWTECGVDLTKTNDTMQFMHYILYGDMSDLDEPYYTQLLAWEKREGLAS